MTLLEGSPYVQYQYGYPHKTAYRALTPARPLEEVWAHEDKSSLSLYVHVPFCEMRCGFCNLFTAANPVDVVMENFVSTLEREARSAKRAIGSATFSRVAFGGGTPTFLPAPLLRRVLEVAQVTMETSLERVPTCVEVSPETATNERLALLEEYGVSRISMGVQSFLETEAGALARPQRTLEVKAALERIRARRFHTLNLDLIYGIEGQTEQSFMSSIDAALEWKPEELYLYPLYVRPKTFLGKRAGAWDDFRLALYRFGRDALISRGYVQHSMRYFRRADAGPPKGTPYRCQDEGMIGLGVGARSYTRTLHYSSEWAVSPRAVRGIIDDYAARPDASFDFAHHGVELDAAEQRRRHLILSLLSDGLDEAQWRQKFGSSLETDVPELKALHERSFIIQSATGWQLTDAGRERSDAIGPFLQSPKTNALMQEYELR